ncbi:MAG TPA: inositol monophosphatase family protein, partial [Phycisphaerae bacterium]|nr:inositol monophosphatase family protein [Phycisphaerae bacterium]
MNRELLDTAVVAAQAGADILRHYFRGTGLDVRRKGENDFVTRADRESEEAIVEAILGRFPDHRVLGEEG